MARDFKNLAGKACTYLADCNFVKCFARYFLVQARICQSLPKFFEVWIKYFWLFSYFGKVFWYLTQFVGVWLGFFDFYRHFIQPVHYFSVSGENFLSLGSFLCKYFLDPRRFFGCFQDSWKSFGVVKFGHWSARFF